MAETPVPRWNPPAIPPWKGVYHLHRVVQDRMSSAAFGAAIKRGWDDCYTGILPAEVGKPRPLQYSTLMRPKVGDPLKRISSAAPGGDVLAVKDTSNKSVTALQILAPMQVDTRGNRVVCLA